MSQPLDAGGRFSAGIFCNIFKRWCIGRESTYLSQLSGTAGRSGSPPGRIHHLDAMGILWVLRVERSCIYDLPALARSHPAAERCWVATVVGTASFTSPGSTIFLSKLTHVKLSDCEKRTRRQVAGDVWNRRWSGHLLTRLKFLRSLSLYNELCRNEPHSAGSAMPFFGQTRSFFQYCFSQECAV
jgi:hypothetical protein